MKKKTKSNMKELALAYILGCKYMYEIDQIQAIAKLKRQELQTEFTLNQLLEDIKDDEK